MPRPRLPSVLTVAALVCVAVPAAAQEPPPRSIAREWNEVLLEAIRNDLARPTVHARNLFHVSVAMWDAWAAYDVDGSAATYLHHERATADDVVAARRIAISHAAYGVLRARFARSVGAAEVLPALDAKMEELGLDSDDTTTTGDTPAAIGNRIAGTVLAFGRRDGSNEKRDYANRVYEPVNPPLLPKLPGNPDLIDPDRWQPLALDFFIDQSGNVVPGGSRTFLSPEWGIVTPFSLSPRDRTIHERDGAEWWLFHDPGPPALFDGGGRAEYRAAMLQVIEFSSELDPADGRMIDISPNARGDNTFGTNDGDGHDVNPATGLPYPTQVVPAGDYYRVLAEFWADGPDSETPPGHWFVIANQVNDHPELVRRIGGVGPELDPLEWDVKLYLALGGTVHDAAVAAWGVKGWYDFIRPISAIRWMADQGQSSEPAAADYHVDGIPLVPGLVERITDETAGPGGRHEHLRGPDGMHVGKIAIRAWRGPDFVDDPAVDTAGVDWIRAEDWWPYQRPSFVTPPFAGYVSGHSTFSRAAAELLTAFTGDPFFPGGVGEFPAPRNEFLVFEEGPSQDVTLQWATYRDASDECSISRIYGGIHPRIDDIPGRYMGLAIGQDAFARAQRQFAPAEDTVVLRARARKRGRRRGIVRVHGSIEVGPAGVDLSRGVALTVQCDGGLHAAGSATADEVRMRSGGRVRVRSRDRSIRGTLRPGASFGDVPLLFDLKIRMARYDAPEASALRVRVHTADGVHEGTIDACVKHGRRGTKLTWNPRRLR